MAVCGCGDLAVERWDADACLVPFRLELAPDVGGARIEAEHAAFHAIADGLKPCPQLRFPFALRKSLDATADLADGDRADVEFALVLAQPCDNLRVRLRLHRLAIHIRVNEIAHSDGGSRSSASRAGISKVTGQASSRSTRPRFAGWVTRRRVMVSSSSMETSKSSPACRCIFARTGPGRTT